MATYLQRTGSGAYYKKMTISFWVKRSKLGEQGIFTRREGSATANLSTCHFTSADQLLINFRDGGGNSKYYIITNRVFRDVNAWYHIVFAIDGDNATAGDRSKLYINGVRETSFSLLNNPSSTGYEVNMFLGGSYPTYVARGLRSQTDGYLTFEGCMSHFHCSTGHTYDASVFGSTDSTTGEWQINTSPSFTPGTDGFTILKDGITITDQSANSNNFTLSTGTLTKTEDNPSNVFTTLNPLNQTNSGAVFSHGNNKMSISGQWLGINSTLFMVSGKYYWEIKYGSGNYDIGIAQLETAATQISEISTSNHGYIGRKTGGYALAQNGGQPYKVNANSNDGNYGSQASSGNILMVAYDADNGKLFTGINGAWNNSSNPATGASPMYTVTSTEFYCPSVSVESGSLEINFGNGYFGTTAVSSAGTNASGNGIFEYNVPTGYTALSTKGLNL